jgi:hypothetical protein
MSTQSRGHGGLLNDVWAQLALLAGVSLILILLAAKYVW